MTSVGGRRCDTCGTHYYGAYAPHKLTPTHTDAIVPPNPRRRLAGLAVPAKTERNQAIVERRRHGATLAVIGAEFGITRERVRQIVTRWRGDTTPYAVADRPARSRAMTDPPPIIGPDEYERRVDPDGVLPDVERKRRANALARADDARREYFALKTSYRS